MIANRLIALIMAVVLTVGCIPRAWAADEPAAQTEAQSETHGGAAVAAALSNTIYVPGKAILCATSAVLWTAAMLTTFGACYKECAHFAHDNCTGKWMVTPDDITAP